MKVQIIGATFTALVASAVAQGPAPERSPDRLESAYWACILADDEHNAKHQRMDEATFTHCAHVSKELQTRRFGGDFGKLHEWTKAHKAQARAGKAAYRAGPD